jgi:hypothetical protein
MRRGPVLTVVFDAALLITACKIEVQGVLAIDDLLPACWIVIAPRVEEEVAILGASYPDGVVAGEPNARGGIRVVVVAERKWTRYLADDALGDGERDSTVSKPGCCLIWWLNWRRVGGSPSRLRR